MSPGLEFPGNYTVNHPTGLKNEFTGEKPLGAIISELLKYVFAATGILLFIYLLFGGFQLLTSAGEPKTVEEAKGKITNAIIGFVIIFIAYWLLQFIQSIFGLE
jgi:hypothetical protein